MAYGWASSNISAKILLKNHLSSISKKYPIFPQKKPLFFVLLVLIALVIVGLGVGIFFAVKGNVQFISKYFLKKSDCPPTIIHFF